MWLILLLSGLLIGTVVSMTDPATEIDGDAVSN